MTADQVAAKLDRAKPLSGKRGYKASCPCAENHRHGDRNVSFAVWEGDDGWLHFKCQTGCRESEILAALGMRDDDRKLGPAPKSAETEYDYTDADGKYLFTKVRIPQGPKGKRFLLKDKRLDKFGLGHISGWQDAVYRAADVAKAVADGKPVYLCEGEKGADAVAAAGAVGTCQPLGADSEASKWREAHTKALTGADVVIVADRDETGEDYAVRVAAKLQGKAKSVVMAQSLTEGETDDVFDHLKAGHPLSALVTMNGKATDALIRALKRDEPERSGQKWLRASDVQEKQVEWLWPLYVPIGEVTMIVGNPGDGKSTIAQAIVTAVTTGAELFGDKVAQGSAVFLSAEQSVASVTVPRFRRMGADLSQIVLPDEVDENDEPVPFVLDKAGMEELRALCLDERPKLVVIDTVTAYIEASRDFNSANQTREWMRRLADIARQTPCAVALLGHLNKNSNAHPLMRILGSIDFVGAARSVLLVGKDPDDPDVRGLAQIKSNVGPFGEPRGFRLDGDTFCWTDGSDLDANRMLQPAAIQAAESTRDRCERWLRGLFKDGNVVEAVPKDEATGKIGEFTSYMVTATKRRLGIVSRNDTFSEGGWVWVMGGADGVYRGGE